MASRRGPTTNRLAICLIVPAGPGATETRSHRAAILRQRDALPTGLPSLAALTPIGHEITLVHDAGGPLDWARLCDRHDVVALTGSHAQRQRLLEILGLGRRGAATICVAGPVVAEDEPALEQLCNVRFVGALDETWPRFIDDLAAGRHTLRRYRRPEAARAWSTAIAMLVSRWRRLRAAAPA